MITFSCVWKPLFHSIKEKKIMSLCLFLTNKNLPSFFWEFSSMLFTTLLIFFNLWYREKKRMNKKNIKINFLYTHIYCTNVQIWAQQNFLSILASSDSSSNQNMRVIAWWLGTKPQQKKAIEIQFVYDKFWDSLGNVFTKSQGGLLVCVRTHRNWICNSFRMQLKVKRIF